MLQRALFFGIISLLFSGVATAQNTAIFNKIDSLIGAGNPGAALPLAVQLRDEGLKKDNKRSLEMALNERRVGYVLGEMAQFGLADSVLLLSEQICREVEKEESVDLAMIINSRAVLYAMQSQYEASLPIFQQVEAIRVKKLGEKHIETLGVRNNIGTVYLYMGRLQEAEQLLTNCIAICEQNKVINHHYYPKFLESMSRIRAWQGRNQQAIAYQNKVVAWNEKKYGREHVGYMSAIDNLTYLLDDIGAVETVDSLTRDQLAFWEKRGDVRSTARIVSNLGTLQMQLGQYAAAKDYFLRAQDMNIKNNDSLAYAMNVLSLGNWYFIEKEYEKALDHFARGVKLVQKLAGQSSWETGQALLQQLEIFIFLDRHDEALAVLAPLEVLNEKLVLPAKSQSNFLLLKARLAQSRNLYDEAVAAYNKALEYEINTSNNLSYIADLQKDKALMYQYFNRPTEGIATMNELLELRKLNLFAKIALLSDHQRQKIAEVIESDFSLLANFLHQSTPADSDVAALFNLKLFYKNILETTSRKTQAFILNSGDSLLLANYQEWLDLREQLNSANQLSAADAQQLNIDRKTVEERALALEKSWLKRGIPAVQPEKYTTWTDIRDALKPQEAAVEVMRFQLAERGVFRDTALYAIAVITPGCAAPKLIFLENGNELESFISGQYKNEISRKKDLSAIIYENMWAPVAAHLTGYTTVYFSPDGVFHKINLNTLRKPDGTYLVDQLDLVQLTNLSYLLERNPESSGKTPGLAAFLGNPKFNISKTKTTPTDPSTAAQQTYRDLLVAAGGDLKLPNLPGSEREVKAVAQKLSAQNWNTMLLTGINASEDTLRKIKSPKVLHLATHGYFMNQDTRTDAVGFAAARADKNPALRSMLFLKGAENTLEGEFIGRNDGILTAFEAAVLPLEGTELVVLSACNTGLGQIQNGEGVYGLQRAFRIAGAQSLIMSLWEVEDAATVLLMTAFYDNWTSGMSKTAAFHKAQLTLKAKYPQPFYWGSFILVNG